MPNSTSPEALHHALADAFNRHDLEQLVALYEEHATLVPQPGHRVSGVAALRAALSGFLSLRPRETFVETLSVVPASDLALTRSRWGLKGTDASGATVTLEHYGFEVMRRQPDGSWRFLIDDPFAGDPASGSR
jgi:ketosteroid isomerase-like protein